MQLSTPIASLSLIELQERVAFNRDQTSYKKIFQLFYHPLLQFSFDIIKNREASEEIVSDVMVKIWEKKESLVEIENLKIYVYKATKNRCINYINRNKKYDEVDADDIDMKINFSFQNPLDILIKNELKDAIFSAVNRLPPKCKMAYKLVREDGLTYKEVAKVMEISENTVDRHLNNALHKLVRALQTHLN